MIEGVGAIVGEAAGRAVVRAGGRALDARRRRHIADTARTFVPVRTAVGLLEELQPQQVARLAAFVDSPDFEHLALQVVLALQGPEPADDILIEVRDATRQCLRHAVQLPAERLTGVTDVVFDALTIACRAATSDLGVAGRPNGALTIAVQSHLGAMAARNSRLLAGLTDLAAVQDAAQRLRRQMLALRGHIHLGHLGTSRAVPWEQLFVTPALRVAHATAAGEEPAVPTIEELVEPGCRTVLLGDPGVGKSTLAAKIAYDVAAAAEPRVPFLVILRDFVDALRHSDRTFTEHLVAVGRVPYGVDLTLPGVEYLLLNGRAVVIVDGLDELTDLSLRRRVVQVVDGFAALYPLIPIVVTSRQVGYAEIALSRDAFRSYVLAPLDDGQVEAYARNWFALDDGTPLHERDERCTAFLRDSQAIQDLRSNSLLLSLLCAMYASERYIPKNRAQVYERCATMLFDRWDSMRGVPMPLRFHGHVRGAIIELAWQMLAVGNVPALPRRKVLGVLRSYLVAKRTEEVEAEFLAEGFLDFCAGRAWILVEAGTTDDEPVYAFAHRTFVEYFAAEHLVRHHVGPQAVWRALAPRLADSTWPVIAQLVLQLLDRNVDDGGEQLLALALAEARSATGDRRYALTAFLSQATQHLPLAPATIEECIALTVADAKATDVDDRFRYWPGTSLRERTRRRDGPLQSTMYSCLAANLVGVHRALERHLAAGAAVGDDATLYLIHNLTRPAGPPDERRQRFWSELEEQLQQRYADHFVAWWRRRAWGRLWGTGDDPAVVEDMVARFGVAPLYTGDAYGDGVTAPGVVLMLTNDPDDDRRSSVSASAVRLRDILLEHPTPWIPADEWWSQLGDVEPQIERWMARRLYDEAWPGGEDLGTYAILCLPYLESADRLRDQAFVATAAALVHARRTYRETGRYEPPNLPGIPDACREFVQRWIRGLCVVG